MKREVEEANTTHVKWFLPIPITHYTELIVGEFIFDPYEDSSKAFARHIREKTGTFTCLPYWRPIKRIGSSDQKKPD